MLSSSPDPDGALHFLTRLLDEKPGAFQWISRSPASLQFLLAVFSNSNFLSEQLIQTPEWLEALPTSGDLHRVISAEEYEGRLDHRLAPYGDAVPPAHEFALFRRQQVLRILIRDLLGFGTLSDITEELSNLADAMIESACRRIRDSLQRRHGRADTGFAVLALGKHGGRELNYSSDIDLLFLYSGNGETSGNDPISYKELFKKLCIQLTELLGTHTQQGMTYRIDLRLRPEGSLGEVCISLDGACNYYQKRARDWELQMLIKARIAAGDRATARQLIEFVEPLIYSTTTDFSKVEAVSEARLRISEKLAKRRTNQAGFDVKLAPGGIRDIEFLVQCLQRLHGGREPWIRHGGTLLALFRLRDHGLLSEIEYSRLASAYQFLRNLEHRLQFAEDRQTHTLPVTEEELELLALRMPPAQLGSAVSARHLNEQLKRHLSEVREIYDRVIHAHAFLSQVSIEKPARTMEPGTGPVRATAEPPPQDMPPAIEPATAEPAPSLLFRSIAQKAPDLAAVLSRTTIKNGARALDHFLEAILPMPDYLEWLNQDPVLSGFIIDLFEHSPFFAEQLNRKPELLDEIRLMRSKPQTHTQYGQMPPLLAGAPDLRRFYNREMLRIQCESICLRTPIFETLQRTSALADCAIASAYTMALDAVLHSQPPASGSYQTRQQMAVVALGRLGTLEFDLGSDADLNFILPDKDSDEKLFWTRVAEKMIDILTSYTGDGVMFAVDTRLRPNGREGPLLQTESAYKDYFAKGAQAWEGITIMKSRAVAGNFETGTRFLSELQDVDWRRYGQGGRSKQELLEMRQRLEQEQGGSNPLKAGPGGYYDIDFALMYLRLKSAGFFFEVLNTPARIGVIEKMGHLDRADAAFLLDAATFYRAVDHGLRLSSGHAEGRLPAAQLQLDILADLVGRWTPEHLHDQPLPLELAQIQERTREYFDRLFRA
ncbi:MAG: glutamine-synthetase adenylyltransferase [Acidobacteriia bacterium]|nr:glutamine-synthetase adenylyltransferase [Terriglobia bacterium]